MSLFSIESEAFSCTNLYTESIKSRILMKEPRSFCNLLYLIINKMTGNENFLLYIVILLKCSIICYLKFW